MAKITYAPAVKHLHGHLGDMVFKSRTGEDIVASKSRTQVNQPNTPAQQAVKGRTSGRRACYAKGVDAGRAGAQRRMRPRPRKLHSNPMRGGGEGLAERIRW